MILVTLFANQLGESPAVEGSAGPLNDLQIVSKSGTPADVSKIEAALSVEDRKLNMLGVQNISVLVPVPKKLGRSL